MPELQPPEAGLAFPKESSPIVLPEACRSKCTRDLMLGLPRTLSECLADNQEICVPCLATGSPGQVHCEVEHSGQTIKHT